MTELLKESDFSVNVPYVWKKRKLKDANEALQTRFRVEQQIIHWERIPEDNIFRQVILDELYFLRDGRV